MRVLARHHMIEFESCDSTTIDRPRRMLASLRRFCREAALHNLRHTTHRFKPQGLTILMVLKESHLAFSSWPEYGYVSLHLFLCGPVPKLNEALGAFAQRIGARRKRARNWTCGTAGGAVNKPA